MSVCGYVSTKYGIVYGTDSQLTPNSLFLEPYKKYEEFEDGSVMLGVGEVAAWRKLCIEFATHEFDIDKIDYKSLLPSTLDGSIEAILIRPDGTLYSIDGPHGIYQLKRFGYYVTGSGAGVCLGSLYAYCRGLNTKDLTLKQAEEYLRSSLGAACEIDEFCSEPLFVNTFTSHIASKKKRA